MKTILFAVFLVLLHPRPASAYLDPGNGSYLFQIMLGFLFTALFSLRLAWSKVVLFLKRLLPGRSKIDPEK